ncbi:BAH_G0000070.mRNA.1.CDS.1 [Saccharomyces cerevisiae]|nr:BAH_G0000070.mRNA.1.CDS.1 [Saccharomyces cerevisiae]CAI7033107.1 BAH_G0000070.mRNA.1.CDS.1 [Saccharomyces cerevisiae]
MYSIVKEIIVDPYKRLKWGFIPVKRQVEDLPDDLNSTEIFTISNSIQSHETAENFITTTSEKDQLHFETSSYSEHKDNVNVTRSYEYRDEADRPWWRFFDEQEYRINEKERSHNKWYSWFKQGTSFKEKKLLIKLDVLLAFYSCIAYWVKYLDTVNINNAYVSGMKEDLGFQGNDLVHTQVMYTPRLMLVAFEAPSYLAYQYLFGSFYKHDEMVRRSAFYYLGQYIGILSAGGIQSAVYSSLNGVNGLEGWRWNFIIDAIVSVVVGLIGFYSLPGDPYNCYSIFLTDDEIRLARKRLKENQTGKSDFETKVFDIKLWKTIFSDWKIYILTLWNIFCWNDSNVSSGAYLLWLKSLKRYSIPKLNQLSMITPGLGMVYLMLTGIIADKLHSRWLAIIFTQVFNIIGNSILAAWDVTEGAKWFAFMLQCFGWAMAPVLYSWQNDICRRDAQTRAITLVTMNIMAQSSTAWISVLVWKTEEAPRYLKGFTFTACSAFCLSIWTFVVLYFYKRDERNNAKKNGIVLYNSKHGVEKPTSKEVETLSVSDKK